MVGAVAGGLGLAACSGCDSPAEQAPTSGADAGAPDVALADAARDVGYLQTDLLPADQWAPIPGFPQECGERIARDPNTAVPQLDWKPCSAKWGPGCKRIDNTWSKWPYRAIGPGREETLRRVDGKPRLSYTRTEWVDNLRFSRSYSVLENVGGERIAAMGVAPQKSGKECSGRLFAGRDTFAVAASLNRSEHLAISPTSGTPKLVGYNIPLDGVLSVADGPDMRAFLSPGFAFYATEGLATAIYDADKRMVVLANESGKGVAVVPHVDAGEGALALLRDGSGSPVRVGYVRTDGSYAPLFDAEAAHYITGMTLDRGVTPPQIVWTEARNEGGFFASTELWTSPFAMNSAGITKRLVAKDAFAPGVSLIAVSADRGRALFRNGLRSARVVRLSDGMGWNLQADSGEAFREIAGIADDEAWLFVTQPDPVVETLPAETGLLRVRIDDLGPPTVPRGF